MIRAAGFAVSARFGVIANPIANYPKVARSNFIDDYVLAKLRRFNVLPSELSTDSEFLRRVCLDLSGTLPPPNRVREFLASKDPSKREKLIETLLILLSTSSIGPFAFRTFSVLLCMRPDLHPKDLSLLGMDSGQYC
jgi:hypothetical protein